MAFANFNCDLSIIILKYYKDTQSNKYDGNHILSQFEHFLLLNQFLSMKLKSNNQKLAITFSLRNEFHDVHLEDSWLWFGHVAHDFSDKITKYIEFILFPTVRLSCNWCAWDHFDIWSLIQQCTLLHIIGHFFECCENVIRCGIHEWFFDDIAPTNCNGFSYFVFGVIVGNDLVCCLLFFWR